MASPQSQQNALNGLLTSLLNARAGPEGPALMQSIQNMGIDPAQLAGLLTKHDGSGPDLMYLRDSLGLPQDRQAPPAGFPNMNPQQYSAAATAQFMEEQAQAQQYLAPQQLQAAAQLQAAQQRADAPQDLKRYDDRAPSGAERVNSMPDVLAALAAGRNRMPIMDPPQLGPQVPAFDSIMLLREVLQTRGGMKPNVQDVAYDLMTDVAQLAIVLKRALGEPSQSAQPKQNDARLAEEFSADILFKLIKICDLARIDLHTGISNKMHVMAAASLPHQQMQGVLPQANNLMDMRAQLQAHAQLAGLAHGHVAPARPPSAGHMQAQTGAEGHESPQTEGNKRKRFTDEQLAGLQELATKHNWSLPAVTKEEREQFCEKFGITRERLHNFFNNRKPKDLKKPRTPIPTSRSLGINGEVLDVNVPQAESQSGDSEPAC